MTSWRSSRSKTPPRVLLRLGIKMLPGLFPRRRSPGTKECAPCQGWAFYNLPGPWIISNHKEPLAGP